MLIETRCTAITSICLWSRYHVNRDTLFCYHFNVCGLGTMLIETRCSAIMRPVRCSSIASCPSTSPLTTRIHPTTYSSCQMPRPTRSLCCWPQLVPTPLLFLRSCVCCRCVLKVTLVGRPCSLLSLEARGQQATSFPGPCLSR